jgi:hypothetical protein
MFQTILTSHPRCLLESARHGFYHGMMEDVLNDESENISLSQLLDLPHNSCIKNETCVREADGIFKIEVPDNVRKMVIVKAQVHGVMTYITPHLFFFAIFFLTLLNIILVSNNHRCTISFSLY